MDLQLTGKKALVTGSSTGLGEAIATMLAAEGATVVVHGRNAERVSAVAATIKSAGGAVETALGDLATDAGADAVSEAAQANGPVDILVNNAGIFDQLSWTEASPDIWVAMYEANVVSAVRMIQRLVPSMRERHWGRVVQIGGGLAIQPMAVQPHYNASLAARHNLAVSLARELKDTGITSNVVSPGAILTDAVRSLIVGIAPSQGWPDDWEGIERAVMESWVPSDIGRFGTPSEIAGAVAYLCSPYAAYISGATIRVDGGIIRNVQ